MTYGLLRANEKMDSRKILWAFIGFLFLLFIFFISLDGMLLWDEHAYMANARNHLSHSYFTEEFRFPLLEFVVALAWAFTGESILAAQLLAVSFSLLLVFFVFLLAREFVVEERALLVSIITGLSSQFLFWGFRVYNDIFGMLLVVMSIYFFVKAHRDKRYSVHLFFLAGLLTGFVFLARYPLVLVPGIFLLYLLYEKKFREFFFSCAGAFIPFGLWVADNLVRFGNPFYQFFAQAGIVGEYSAFESPLLLLGHFWEAFSFSLVFLAGFALYMLYGRVRGKRFLWLMFLGVVVNLVFYLFFVSLKLERYLLVFIPFLALFMVLGLEYFYGLLKKLGGVALVLLSLFLVVPVVVSSAYTVNDLVSSALCTRDGAVKEAIGYVQENIGGGDVVISDTWVYYGFHVNTRVVSVWTDEVWLLFEKHDPELVILTYYDGLDVARDSFDDSNLIVLEAVFSDGCGQEVLVYRRR